VLLLKRMQSLTCISMEAVVVNSIYLVLGFIILVDYGDIATLSR
jgi:hypothetical protein